MKKLNSFKLFGLFLVIFTMISLPSAGRDYYSKVIVNTVGNGKVYVSYKNTSDSPSYNTTSEATSGKDSQSQAPTHTYYLYAQGAEDAFFLGWATSEDGEIISKDNPYTCKFSAKSTNGSSPTTQTYYAIFSSEAIIYYSENHVYLKKSKGSMLNELTQFKITDPIIYTVANNNVVTVADDGTITAVSNGTTTITASVSGLEASYKVTVIDDITAGKTQIGNGDFEDWSNVTTNNHAPNNWNSFETNTGSLASMARAQQVAMKEDHRPGSNGLFCADIYSRSINILFFKAIAQGNMTLGRINAGNSSAAHKDNHNFTDVNDDAYNETISKIPTALKVWVKFVPGATNTEYPYARVAATVHDAYNYITHGQASNDLDDNKEHAIANAEKNFTACDWTELTIPFVMTNNAVIDGQLYIVVNFTTNATPGQGQVGDHLYIDDLELIYDKEFDEVPVTVSDAKYATFVAPFDVKMPASVKASTVSTTSASDDTVLELEACEGNTVTANTPVILSAKAATARKAFGIANATTTTAEAGLLTGVYTNTDAPVGSYVLQNQNGKVGMYKVNASGVTVKANHCYLNVPASNTKAFFFDFNDVTTDINNIESETNDAIYNLSGNRLNKMQKGINIVNGKKVIY